MRRSLTGEMNLPPETVPVPDQGRRRHLILLGVAAVVAHLPALRAGYVLDDPVLLSENPYVRTAAGLGMLLKHELFVATAQPHVSPYYRPLAGLLNWLSYQALGAHTVGQHAFNLLLHALVAVLLFAVCRANHIRPAVAFGAALVFAVHPATAEVVAYLGGRQNMAGWIIGLTAACLIGRLRTLGMVALLGFGATFLGALFHEFFFGLAVPLGLLCLGEKGRSAPARAAATLAGGGVAVAAILQLRSWLRLADMELHGFDLASLFKTNVGVALRLVKDVCFPFDLAVDVSIVEPTLPTVILVLIVAAAMTIWLPYFIGRKQRHLLGLVLAGMSIVALSVVVHSGVAMKRGIISDRYAYATLIGVFVCAAALANCHETVTVKGSALRRLVRRWGAVVVAMAVLPLTWARDRNWHDETSLELAMIADRPQDPETWLATGMLYLAKGDIEQAYPHCRAYANARPELHEANLCVGVWLLKHDRPEEAAAIVRSEALSWPENMKIRRVYLAALIASHDYAQAHRTLNEWSRMFPGAKDLAEAKAALGSSQ